MVKQGLYGCLFSLVSLLVCIYVPCQAQQQEERHVPQDFYQFHISLPYKNATGDTKTTTAYLYIPANCKRVKGVLIGSQNVLEQWLFEHPLLRKACDASNLAILWACPGFFVDGKTHYPELNISTIRSILAALADISGYEEIASVPWLPVGHSGTNNLVSVLVETVPDHLIAAIKMKGGPGFANTAVPVMCTAGEYFEWSQQKEDLIHPRDSIPNYTSVLKERKSNHHPLTYFFDPNTGHFDCSEALTKLVADYITQVCRHRLSASKDTTLLPIDLDKGWVAGLPLPGAIPVHPKLYKEATGDERNLPFYFSKQQAQQAIKLASINFKRKPQIAAFADEYGKPAGFNRGIVWPIPYTTGEDGINFRINSTFLSNIPDTFLLAGTALGHNNNEPQAILLCGNARHISNNTFTISPGRSYKASATYFILRQQGDAEYRTNIEPGQLVLTANQQGQAQQITFDSLPNMSNTKKAIALRAASTSGMQVRFFVKSGPAVINGNMLTLTGIPPRTRYPVKVTVVAWQWGRNKEPLVQTAPFAERSFYIIKKYHEHT